MASRLKYELQVDLGDGYPVRIGQGLIGDRQQIQPYLAGNQVLIVSNERVAPLYLAPVHSALEGLHTDTLILPDGEEHKNLGTLSKVFDTLAAGGHRRTTTMLALGGGVIGDMVGFAAACYQRGVAFIQLPTTLLAQVDSSVGGKTAVNHRTGKNLIGAFHQPALVLADTDVLATLPDREYGAGLAELVKHAIIRDADLFGWLEERADALRQREPEVLAEALYRSVSIKIEIVAADEREAGQRALLNLGHTFAHALEVSTGYGTWLHGEAVAIGILLAAELSVREKRIKADLVERIRRMFEALGLPTQLPAGTLSADTLRTAMATDKKARDAGLQLILLDALGEATQTLDFQERNLMLTLEMAVGGG